MTTDKEIVKWIDSVNICSIEHGLWLTPEDYNKLKTLFPEFTLHRWLKEHNAMTESLNIGSAIWQPVRRRIKGE